MIRPVFTVFLASVLALLAYSAPARAGGLAQADAVRPYVREVLQRFQEPLAVEAMLKRQGVRLLGHSSLGMQNDGHTRLETISRDWTPEGDWNSSSAVAELPPGARMQPATTRWRRRSLPGVLPTAGRQSDFVLSMWAYEWRTRDGQLREELIVSGYWQRPEWGWMAAPHDVIDVRWIVGDLTYVSAAAFDGVENGEKTQGVATFTVPDSVHAWDLFVSFTPSSNDVIGRATNLFANYTHTWLGFKLGVTLGAGPTGSTGTVSVTTDAFRWTRGNGLPLHIGKQETGYATTAPTSAGNRVRRLLEGSPVPKQEPVDTLAFRHPGRETNFFSPGG